MQSQVNGVELYISHTEVTEVEVGQDPIHVLESSLWLQLNGIWSGIGERGIENSGS